MKVRGWVNPFAASPAGIGFGNRAFTEPVPFSLALPPVSSGIYAILRSDDSCRPRPFRVINFGESGNFYQCVTEHHECFDDWVKEAGGLENVYVAFCPTPLLKQQQRRWIENDLIARYRPTCNLKNNPGPFFYKPLLSTAK